MMRTLFNWIAVIATLLAVAPVHAQQRQFLRERFSGKERPALQRQERADLRQGGESLRQGGEDNRRERADLRQGGAERSEGARPNRMSPDERRQLRQDIHDAGRELYRRQRRPLP
jgi:hypothetical protein